MLVRKKVSKLDPVQRALFKRFRTVNVDTPLGEVSRLLDRDSFVLVLSTQRCYTGKDQLTSRSTIFSIVTRLDLLSYILTLEASFCFLIYLHCFVFIKNINIFLVHFNFYAMIKMMRGNTPSTLGKTNLRYLNDI